MTLVVRDDFDTTAPLNTYARVGSSQVDTDNWTVVLLVNIGLDGNRAQKKKGETRQEEKRERRREAS